MTDPSGYRESDMWPDDESGERRSRRWIKVVAIVVAVVVLLAVVVMLIDGGDGGHGPSRHGLSESGGGQMTSTRS